MHSSVKDSLVRPSSFWSFAALDIAFAHFNCHVFVLLFWNICKCSMSRYFRMSGYPLLFGLLYDYGWKVNIDYFSGRGQMNTLCDYASHSLITCIKVWSEWIHQDYTTRVSHVHATRV